MKSGISLVIISLCTPFLLMATITILPTFDDFTTLQSPQFTPLLHELLLPNDSFWRPFDYLFGCLLGRHIWLFPALNHIVITLGHAANAVLLWAVCREFKLSHTAADIATLFFFFSTATLGTTLAVDGLNQTFSQLWGLAALHVYIKTRQKPLKHVLWPLLVMMAALSKENGLAWAVVIPLLAFTFSITGKRTALRDTGIGLLTALAYLTARLLLAVTADINSEYTEATLASHLKDLLQLLAFTFLPIDYMSLLYAPSRNWLLAAATLLLAMPFVGVMFFGNTTTGFRNKRFWGLLAAFLIIVSPHLLTLVSIMHNYAGLSLAAIITAFLIDSNRFQGRTVITAFLLFTLSAAVADVHHFMYARQSGFLGRQMASQVIDLTKGEPENVACITVCDDATPKYSSFGVRPVDCFAWGESVRYYTGYRWPRTLENFNVDKQDSLALRRLTDSLLHHPQSKVECLWIVSDHCIEVLRP
jgi:hypothetical protein